MEECISFLLLSCFLSPLSKFVNCNMNNETRKKSKTQAGKVPNLNKVVVVAVAVVVAVVAVAVVVVSELA